MFDDPVSQGASYADTPPMLRRVLNICDLSGEYTLVWISKWSHFNC
jgi:hypothetical protein